MSGEEEEDRIGYQMEADQLEGISPDINCLEVKLEPGVEQLLGSSYSDIQKKKKEDVEIIYDNSGKGTTSGQSKWKRTLGDFPCPECDFYTKRLDKLKLHIRTKHQGLRFRCEHCEYEAQRPDKLRQHKRNVHGLDTLYRCEECDFVADAYRILQAHAKEEHNKVHQCKYCSYTSNRPFRLREHIERKHETSAHPCEHCDYIAPSSLSLSRHQDNVHKEKRYPCDQCDYVGKRSGQLNKHKKSTHEHVEWAVPVKKSEQGEVWRPTVKKRERSWSEEEGEEVSSPVQGLNESKDESIIGDTPGLDMADIDPLFWLLHPDLPEVKAELVEAEYKADLAEAEYKADLAEAVYEDNCEPLSDASGDQEALEDSLDAPPASKRRRKKKHTEANVTPRKRVLGYFPCDQCSYTSQRKDKLTLHQRAVHEGVRFPCDMCEYSATRPDKLKLHNQRKHFDPQPRKQRKPKYLQNQEHLCDKCDYKTVKMRNLQAHVVRNHSDSIYQCDQCDYVATYKHNLKNHYNRMHGETMLMCDKCDYTSRDPTRLRYHNQSKHEGIKYPCDLCDYVSSLLCELKRHLRRKHGNDKFSCDLCDYVGKRIDHLRDHRRRIHDSKTDASPVKVDPSGDSKEGQDLMNLSDYSALLSSEPGSAHPSLLGSVHPSLLGSVHPSLLGSVFPEEKPMIGLSGGPYLHYTQIRVANHFLQELAPKSELPSTESSAQAQHHPTAASCAQAQQHPTADSRSDPTMMSQADTMSDNSMLRPDPSIVRVEAENGNQMVSSRGLILQRGDAYLLQKHDLLSGTFQGLVRDSSPASSVDLSLPRPGEELCGRRPYRRFATGPAAGEPVIAVDTASQSDLVGARPPSEAVEEGLQRTYHAQYLS